MINPLTDSQGNLSTYLVEQAINEIRGQVDDLTLNLSNVATANPFVDAPQGNSSVVPQVTGIRSVDSAPFVIGFVWDPSTITNLLRYEIYVDTVNTFPEPIIIPWTGVEYSYAVPNAVDPDTGVPISYYIKVRAIDNELIAGKFSNILDGTTGLVTTADIQEHAASLIVNETYASFDPAYIENNGATATYGNLNITTVGRPVLLYIEAICVIAWKMYSVNSGENRLTATLLCDGVQVGRSTNLDFNIFVGYGSPIVSQTSTVQETITFPNPIHNVGAGAHEYSVKLDITNSASNTLKITPTYLDMSAYELRR